jgi:hypothetical protein
MKGRGSEPRPVGNQSLPDSGGDAPAGAVPAGGGRGGGAAEQGASCELGLTGSTPTLEIKRSAAALCQVQAGTPVRARGYLYGGKLEIGHTLNRETLAGN